jgi:hypothetical protein
MLWGRSGGRCAICKKPLFEDESQTDDPSVLGEECHIVAEEPNGPRGSYPLPPDQRNRFSNLILLCLEHHKIIDDQPEKYTVEELHRIKQEHLEWFQKVSGQFDVARQRDDEIYAGIIDEWAQRADLDNWDDFSYSVLSEDQPRMRPETDRRIAELGEWLFRRIYPDRYPALRVSLENFRHVLADFHGLFREHVVEEGDWLATMKFYRRDEWRMGDSDALKKQYDHHVGLVQDLMVELTRAANYVCERVRETISPGFRMREGIVVARMGMTMATLKGSILRLCYVDDERTPRPYPGLKEFETKRYDRDFCFGDVK